MVVANGWLVVGLSAFPTSVCNWNTGKIRTAGITAPHGELVDGISLLLKRVRSARSTGLQTKPLKLAGWHG